MTSRIEKFSMAWQPFKNKDMVILPLTIFSKKEVIRLWIKASKRYHKNLIIIKAVGVQGKKVSWGRKYFLLQFQHCRFRYLTRVGVVSKLENEQNPKTTRVLLATNLCQKRTENGNYWHFSGEKVPNFCPSGKIFWSCRNVRFSKIGKTGFLY